MIDTKIAKKRPSLYITLASIIVITVVLILSLHAFYTYTTSKEKFLDEIRNTSVTTLVTLQKNIAGMMEAYAVNEYATLLTAELDRSNALAIIVEDYLTGKILGEKAFVSGKIRTTNDYIIDFNTKSTQQREWIHTAYYADVAPIVSSTGQEIGRITIYMQDTLIQQELNSIIKKTIIDTFFISLLLVIALFIALERYILKPLEKIVATIAKKDQHGIPLLPIENYEYQEVALLSESMNSMIATIRTSQEALRESEFRWKFAVDGNGDGLWDWNLKTDEVYFSSQWKRMLGFEDDEIANNISEWKNRIHPDDLEDVYADIERYFHGETTSYINEHRVLCKDGSYKWIRDRGIIVGFTQNNEPLRMIGTHTDISPQKELEFQIIQERNFVKTIIDNANSIIAVIQSDGTMSLLNHYAEKFTGYTQVQTASEPFFWKRFLPSEVQPKVLTIIEEAKKGNIVTNYRNEWVAKDGTARMFEWSNALVNKEDGSLDYIFTIGIDINERYEIQQKLHESNELNEKLLEEIKVQKNRFELAVEGTLDGLWDWNMQTNEMFFSSRFATMLGYSEDELPNTVEAWSSLLHPDDVDGAFKIVNRYLAQQGKGTYENTFRMRTKDGNWRWITGRGKAQFDSDGKPLRFVGFNTDISEQIAHQQQLEFMAKHDTLTKLPNRFLFSELLGLAMRNVKRNKEHLALLFVDLDGFKTINDTFGHRAGDELLCVVAQRMEDIVRENDIVARIGGDEFIIVINNLKNTNEFLPVIERLLKGLSEDVVYEKDILKISASIGISLYPQEQDISNEVLLHQADEAMYEAKMAGKNKYSFYTLQNK
jgi:diguanylate cyclase (GGDEF)-like protein/PAS domain S-box-containing protein